MPEFILDTSGEVPEPKWERPPMITVERPLRWADLDAFTQGYIEALFFTADLCISDQGRNEEPCGFADLAPETLARIIADCSSFYAANRATLIAHSGDDPAGEPNEETQQAAGRDFWYTRNGHGVGFWDGDWLEPYASQLDAAAKAFSNIDAYLGDDGKVYLS